MRVRLPSFTPMTAWKDRNPPRRMVIYEEARNNLCTDCKQMFPPYVMEFDHVRGRKFKPVSTLAKVGSVQALLDEIAKCDLVCANCHAIRTHNRRQLSSLVERLRGKQVVQGSIP